MGPPVLDYGTGAQAALAVTAALLLRERSGKITHPDVAMLDAALMLMTSSITETAYRGKAPKPHGNSSPTRAGYGCYDTAAGRLMIGAFTSRQNAMLWSALGDESTAGEVSALTPAALDARYEQDRTALQFIFLQRSAADWEKLLSEVGVPAARIRTMDEAVSDAQVLSRSVLQQLPQPAEHSTTDSGSSKPRVTTFATKAWSHTGSQTPAPALNLPPVVGQHNDKLLLELGFAAAEIDSLKQAGVI